MLRKDIQGLRAIAVVSVLLFHFWPNHLTGGYVGVDVFFVISGFLITSHLLRKPPVTKKALADFWARRIKRLIPAATVVLFFTVIATLIWLPDTMVQRTLQEAAAAAVYGENWMLAVQATDYLASTDAPTPIQHYWSLSIEEQYYVFWPLLIGMVFLIGRRFLTSSKILVIVMGLIFTASLACSIYLTGEDAAAAYFVTPTRVWELTIGGIVAFLAMRVTAPSHFAVPLAWLGLAMIAAAVVLFTKQIPFPGYTALLPTLGTALVILAASDGMKWSPRRLLEWKPMQFMGDISYSVYLWHWPVVAIAPFALGSEYLVWWQKILFILIVIGVAYLTKIFVEDPVRSSKVLMKTNLRTYVYGVASIAVIVVLSLGIVGINEVRAEQARDRLQKELISGSCIGAAAMREAACDGVEVETLMTPTEAKNDKSVLYEDDCWSNKPFTRQTVCTYGDVDSDIKVALVGNSHAGMWFSALDEIAKKEGWRLDTYLVSECYTVSMPLDFSTETLTTNCLDWNDWAVKTIARGGYNTAIMSNRTNVMLKDVSEKQQHSQRVAGYQNTIDTLLEASVKVFVIRDGPESARNVPDCLAENNNDGSKCTGSRSKVLMVDPLYDAASNYKAPYVKALDLSNRFCDEVTCYVVIGGLIAYFDYGHISNTYAKTLVPDIEPKLVELVHSSAP